MVITQITKIREHTTLETGLHALELTRAAGYAAVLVLHACMGVIPTGRTDHFVDHQATDNIGSTASR